ncbi:hypothetical protein PU560_00735, partial [Georgenia sp. 10Sc9-8]|nr:hypothetical protein [Georgenia halotolerans]
MVGRGGATRSGGAEFSLGLDDTSVLERGLTHLDRPRADFERPLPAPPPTLSLARVQEYARN